MSSSELIALRSRYYTFKSGVQGLISINSQAVTNIGNTDDLLQDAYSLNGVSADGDYVRNAKSTIKSTLNAFNNVIGQIDSKINELNRRIEIARDRELAEQLKREREEQEDLA